MIFKEKMDKKKLFLIENNKILNEIINIWNKPNIDLDENEKESLLPILKKVLIVILVFVVNPFAQSGQPPKRSTFSVDPKKANKFGKPKKGSTQ